MTTIQMLGGPEHGESLTISGTPPSSMLVPRRQPFSAHPPYLNLQYLKREWQRPNGKRISFYVLAGTSDVAVEEMMRAAMAG